MTRFKSLTRLATGAALFLTPPALAQEAAAPAATPAPAVETVDADPALWVVRDADTTIYLFGTVHVLKPGLTWFDEAVKTAFDASDELKIEVVLPENPAELAPLIGTLAAAPAGTTITGRLTPEQLESYTAGLTQFGIPAAALDGFDPWFVGLQLATVMYMRAGYQPGSGAEAVLTAAATSGAKPISGFETAEQQFGFLDSAPDSEQIAGILQMLGDVPEASATFDRLVASWAGGRVDEAASIMNEGMENTPETARILLTDRNRRWADTLKARMDQPGTVFVAVGAGHLAGTGSVQDFLTERGLTVERVEY